MSRGDVLVALLIGLAAGVLASVMTRGLPRVPRAARAAIGVGVVMLTLAVVGALGLFFNDPPASGVVPGRGVHTIEPPAANGGPR